MVVKGCGQSQPCTATQRLNVRSWQVQSAASSNNHACRTDRVSARQNGRNAPVVVKHAVEGLDPLWVDVAVTHHPAALLWGLF